MDITLFILAVINFWMVYINYDLRTYSSYRWTRTTNIISILIISACTITAILCLIGTFIPK